MTIWYLYTLYTVVGCAERVAVLRLAELMGLALVIERDTEATPRCAWMWLVVQSLTVAIACGYLSKGARPSTSHKSFCFLFIHLFSMSLFQTPHTFSLLPPQMSHPFIVFALPRIGPLRYAIAVFCPISVNSNSWVQSGHGIPGSRNYTSYDISIGKGET